MLADRPLGLISSGRLSPQLYQPEMFLDRIVGFVLSELPKWRDHPERPPATNEITLTDQLGTYLSVAARQGFDIITFVCETPDDGSRGRRLDLSVKPVKRLQIVGREYTMFDILIPVECKRLPTPGDVRRDYREYVISDLSSTGGIQRFKGGDHGNRHSNAMMIAYTQSGSLSGWHTEVNGWLEALGAKDSFWHGEELNLVEDRPAERVARFLSQHQRANPGAAPIRLHHLWVLM